MHPAVKRAWTTDSDVTMARKFQKSSNKKGVADIVGFLKNGKFLAIELKWGKNRLSPEQIQFLQDCNDSSAFAFAAWSLDEVIDRMKEA
jgi:VRR-NUC domain